MAFLFTNIYSSIIVMIACFCFLFYSAEKLVKYSVNISDYLNFSRMLTGIFIVGIATTAPESAVSVLASLNKHSQMAFGNAYGSVICNTGLALGFASIFTNKVITIQKKEFLEMVMFFLLIFSISLFFTLDGTVTRREGGSLFLLLFCYIWYSTINKKNPKEVEVKSKNSGILLPIIKFIISVICVLFFSRLIVVSAVNIAKALGVSKTIIGLTVVAIGTSLPEISATISAAKRGENDIAVGTIFGANILNILFVMGLSALARPIHLNGQDIVFGFSWAFIISVVMFILLGFGYKLTKSDGVMLLFVYVIYIGSSFLIRF